MIHIIYYRVTIEEAKLEIRNNPTISVGSAYDAASLRRKSLLGEDANAKTVPPLNGKSKLLLLIVTK